MTTVQHLFLCFRFMAMNVELCRTDT